MEDGAFSPGTLLGASPNSFLDFNYMDELLVDGCLLGTADGSEFLHHSPISNTFFEFSYLLPNLEATNGYLSMSPCRKNTQEERQKSTFQDMIEPQEESFIETQSHCNAGSFRQSQNSYFVEGSELSRRWLIGPMANLGPSSSVMERLIQALEYIKASTRDRDVLIQIWVPVNKEGRRVLTTNDQPFSLDSSCLPLASYRNISVKYQFPAEESSMESVGLPGRVFLGKVPEWTPDVRFFKREEYARVDYAQQYNVCGTLALPIFEQGSRTCFGVIEVVMTTQKINYRQELESVCKALEAVDLRSFDTSNAQSARVHNDSYQATLPEILEVLRYACETHRLPLAQTWVTCIQQGKGGCWHLNENYLHCVSTVDSACYVANPHVQGFHEACSEHHLIRGQGVAGGAFMTNQPCFSPDITSFKKTDYPLSHHARMFRLRAAVAIRLRSVYIDSADFVLEFFLPMDCRDSEEQKKMLSSLSIIIQQACRSLRVITDKELEEEATLPVSEVIVPSDSRSRGEDMPSVELNRPDRSSHEESLWNDSLMLGQQGSDAAPFSHKGKPRKGLSGNSLKFKQLQEDSSPKVCAAVSGGGYSTFSAGSFSGVGTSGERRRIKAEKNITLQVLQQYFSGSLKEAAKSIGVCPTTLKRICRQHGIKRWPSRKIKKVGHSLQKLQLVMGSVHGASGAFQIGSFYSDFPELAFSNLSKANQFATLKLTGHPKPSSRQPESGIFGPQPTESKSSPSSSCSQGSSSSHCCSSGTQQPASKWKVSGSDDTATGDNSGDGVLKRVRSDAQLHATNQEATKFLSRSQSHKALSELNNIETLPTLHKDRGWVPLEGDYFRIKVTCREEKVRFRMPADWGFKDLRQEIVRRFNIDDSSGIHIKYLDDDSEWVLLTCDADLEECIDVCRSSQNQTIKLSVRLSLHNPGTLGISGPPL